MTTDWKALCVELAKVLAEEYGVQREFDSGDPLLGSGAIELLSRVRTALDQFEPEGPSDRIISIAMAAQECAFAWKPTARLIGNVCAEDIADLCGAVLARWGCNITKDAP